MTLDQIQGQLDSLRDHSEDMTREPHHEVIWDMDVIALNAAMEMCELRRMKQVHKVVTMNYKLKYNHYYECPNCHFIEDVIHKYPFCPACGQHLDWRDVHE
jgi:hypothetical protein